MNRLLPIEVTAITIRSGPGKGNRLLIRPREEKYYWTGSYELPVQRALVQRLRLGDTFWDVGAHIGFFTVLAAKLVGDRGLVHAFEPMPRNRERLERSIALNRVGNNIRVHPYAIALEDEIRSLHSHRSSTMWTLVPERGQGDAIVVECRTLDSIAAMLGSPRVVKIDVEGAEVDVLRGARQIAESAGAPDFIVEFTDDSSLHHAKRILPTYLFERLSSRHWLLVKTAGRRAGTVS